MVAIHAPIQKTKTYTPVWERAVFTAARDIVDKQYVRVRVNDLSTMHPDNRLRVLAMKYAEQFVRDMQKQGFQLKSAEADILVSGPFAPRNWSQALNGMYRGTRHVREATPNGRRMVDTLLLPVGARRDQSLEDKADFILEAEFLSTRTVMVEYAIKEGADGR